MIAARPPAGPLLYRGARVGRAGHLFWMYKFRTLKPDAETRLGPYYGEELTAAHRGRADPDRRRPAQDPPRRGAAALERPARRHGRSSARGRSGPTFYAELCREIPQYWQRLVVRPGVTGFAQTRITREETWADKLAHDMEYIADRSVPLYFQVLLATVAKVGGASGPAVGAAARAERRDCETAAHVRDLRSRRRRAERSPTSRRWGG